MRGTLNARLAALVVLSGGIAASAAVSHAASGEEVIKARIDFMKDQLEANWKPLAAFVKGQGTLADVEKHARNLSRLASDIPKHFPKDTGRGKYPDKLTRTLPAVWEDWDGFRKDAQRLAEGGDRLARLAREGKKDEVLEMIGPGGYGSTKIGCVECHDNFRGPRAK